MEYQFPIIKVKLDVVIVLSIFMERYLILSKITV